MLLPVISYVIINHNLNGIDWGAGVMCQTALSSNSQIKIFRPIRASSNKMCLNWTVCSVMNENRISSL